MVAAVMAGDEARVEELLSRDPGLATARDRSGVSVLLLALYHGHRPLARQLQAVHPGLDVGEAAALGDADRLREVLAADRAAADRRTADGFTPLHYAAFFGGEDVAHVLLDAGADPNVRSENDFAVMPLHSAVAGQARVALLLIERGAHVDVRQRHGWTPLHGAADNGETDVVEALLAGGADASLTHDGGLTAADVAEHKGHVAMAARLRAVGGQRSADSRTAQ